MSCSPKKKGIMKKAVKASKKDGKGGVPSMQVAHSTPALPRKGIESGMKKAFDSAKQKAGMVGSAIKEVYSSPEERKKIYLKENLIKAVPPKKVPPKFVNPIKKVPLKPREGVDVPFRTSMPMPDRGSEFTPKPLYPSVTPVKPKMPIQKPVLPERRPAVMPRFPEFKKNSPVMIKKKLA